MGNLYLNRKSHSQEHSHIIFTTKLNSHKLSTTNNSLKIYHQNISGLKYKVNELLSFLYPDLPHIICLTEHHLNHLEMNSTVIENYKLGGSFCRRSTLKGGTCIFVLNHLNHITLNIETNCSDFDIEVCAAKIQCESSHICIFSVYRAPSGNFTHFMYKMDKILKSLYSLKTECIICGDFNIDYLLIIVGRVNSIPY
jgi:exonuclease III